MFRDLFQLKGDMPVSRDWTNSGARKSKMRNMWEAEPATLSAPALTSTLHPQWSQRRCPWLGRQRTPGLPAALDTGPGEGLQATSAHRKLWD